MSNTHKSGTSTFWVSAITLGILACLGGVVYTFVMIQQEAGQEGEYRLISNDMRLLSQDVFVRSRDTGSGEESAAAELEANVESFNILLAQFNNGADDAQNFETMVSPRFVPRESTGPAPER